MTRPSATALPDRPSPEAQAVDARTASRCVVGQPGVVGRVEHASSAVELVDDRAVGPQQALRLVDDRAGAGRPAGGWR